MRVAIIKQLYDVFGSWKTLTNLNYDNLSVIDELASKWPGKASLFSMCYQFKADWYVLNQNIMGDYHFDLIKRNPKTKTLIKKYTENVVALDSIDFDKYDLVITFDPIIDKKINTKAVLAYYVNEHDDVRYFKSQKKVFKNYDLFFDHMMLSPLTLNRVPSQLSFPCAIYSEKFSLYLLNDIEKEDIVYIDWRVLEFLSMNTPEHIKNVADNLQATLGKEIRYESTYAKVAYGISNPPIWGELIDYQKRMGKCKYYVSLGDTIGGAGQGLVDAAAMDCICFGEKTRNKIYHRLICHPATLCDSIVDFPKKFKFVTESKDLQSEIVEWQRWALRHHFYINPIRQLEKAIELKRTKRFGFFNIAS